MPPKSILVSNPSGAANALRVLSTGLVISLLYLRMPFGSGIDPLFVLAAFLAGVTFARGAGLGLAIRGLRQPMLVGLAISVSVAAAVTLSDVAFRPLLQPQYVAIFTDVPLADRLVAFMVESLWSRSVRR